MRMLLALAIIAAAAGAACAGGSSDKTPTRPAATATTSAAALTASSPNASPSAPAATPAVGGITPIPTPAAGEIVDVTGIVGTVSAATNIIQIRRLQGAPVTRIEVTSSTVIQSAGGGTITLGGIHISDRIVASGALDSRGQSLIAAQITVQDVNPAAQPGG